MGRLRRLSPLANHRFRLSSPFEQTVLPHLDAAYNLARWLLRNEQDAEDAVQEACLRACRAADTRRDGDGRAWLLTIVRNVCYTHFRKLRREPLREEFDDEAHGAGDALATGRGIQWRETRRELLHRALERLPEEFREVLVLHELEELPYRDIATVAGIPLGTVMSRLARARARLQNELIAVKEEHAHEL